MVTRFEIPIILASTSPRRIELMAQVSLKIMVLAPEVDERPKRKETPDRLVKRLAEQKAYSVKDLALAKYKRCMIIAADTIVVSPNSKILGKPQNPKEAQKMLSLLSGKTHSVLTGYCIVSSDQKMGVDKKIIRVIRSQVVMRRLTKNAIDAYVRTGEPLDKAGAYGAQGLGTALIERIIGSYTNVVGLPMAQVLKDIEKLSNKKLFSWIK